MLSMEKFVKSEEELREIAHAMMRLVRDKKKSILRYRQVVFDSVYIDRGRKNVSHCCLSSTYNEEDMDARIYSSVHGEELFTFNLPQFEEWKHRSETPYVFTPKGFTLPSEIFFDVREIPTNFEQWDDEFVAFTRDYKNERITRDFGVEQNIVVNSNGGMIVESQPYLSIHYRQGYHPYMITRSVGAYVSNNEEVNRLPLLIEYLPDPTLEQEIRKSRNFTDAFARLHAISHHVDEPDIENSGLSDDLTHDVIMLSGVPIHEIFGHQFEEPVHPLQVGQQSLFPIGKNVQNSNLILRDNPRQRIEGLEVIGSYSFDSYGRPSREKIHIKDSKVYEHLGSEYIDKKNLKTFLGVEKSDSIGNSRQGDDGYFPQARMSCTVLEGKETEAVDWHGKVLMVPFNGYVLDGNFFKVNSSECYLMQDNGKLKRLGAMEGSRAIYDAIIGMHVLPGISHHIGSCSKPGVIEDGYDAEVTVSFLTNHQMWEHLTLRSI